MAGNVDREPRSAQRADAVATYSAAGTSMTDRPSPSDAVIYRLRYMGQSPHIAALYTTLVTSAGMRGVIGLIADVPSYLRQSPEERHRNFTARQQTPRTREEGLLNLIDAMAYIRAGNRDLLNEPSEAVQITLDTNTETMTTLAIWQAEGMILGKRVRRPLSTERYQAAGGVDHQLEKWGLNIRIQTQPVEGEPGKFRTTATVGRLSDQEALATAVPLEANT